MPSLFTNTYQLYKSYTYDVCQWLVNTAASVKNSTHGPGGAHGAKGKPRRPAGKNKKKDKNKSYGQPEALKSPVGVDQLVEMAETIAKHPLEKTRLPHAISAKLSKTIMLRRQYMDLYNPSNDKAEVDVKLQRKNQQHAHFVEVLEHVRKILRATQSVSSPNTQSSEPDQSRVATPDEAESTKKPNSFWVLDVEDVDEDANIAVTNSPDHSKPVRSKTTRSKAERKSFLRDQDEKEDLIFAIFCLFTDMDRLKNLLRDHWNQYKAKLVSLEVVTLMSNVAIGFIRQTEKEFFSDFAHHFPDVKDYLALAFMLNDHIRAGRDPDHQFGPSLPHNGSTADVNELTSFSSFLQLTLISEGFRDDSIDFPWTFSDWFKNYDPTLDRSKMTKKEIFDQNTGLLIGLCPDFHLAAGVIPDPWFEDEFTINIAKHCNAKPPPITVALVFATQLFFDSQILGEESDRPLNELLAAARQYDISLHRLYELKPDYLPGLREDQSGSSAKRSRMLPRKILNDRIHGLKKDLNVLRERVPFFQPIPLTPPFHLHRHHPLLCGTELLHLRLTMCELATRLDEELYSIIFTAHAYNAFRHLGVLDIEWPEIEWFISYYTPEKVFSGYTPTTYDQCFRTLQLINGSAICAGPDSRHPYLPRRLLRASRTGRNWATLSPALQLLKEWNQSSLGTSAFDPTEALLARLLAIKKTARGSEPEDASACGRILAVKALVSAELAGLQHNFLDLHLRCMGLFRVMDHHLRWYIEAFIGEGYLTGGDQLCYIFCWVMLMGSARFRAKFTSTVAELPFLRQDPFRNPRCAFNVAARLMKGFILNEFDMYTGVRWTGGTEKVEVRHIKEYQDLDEEDEDLACQKAELLDQVIAMIDSRPDLKELCSNPPESKQDDMNLSLSSPPVQLLTDHFSSVELKD